MLPFPFSFMGQEGSGFDFFDDFTTSDGTVVVGGVSQYNGWGEDSGFLGIWTIVSNTLRNENTGGNRRCLLRPTAENFTDGWVEVELADSDLIGSHMLGFSVVMRVQGTIGPACYQLRTGTGANSLILAKRSPFDVSTTLASGGSFTLSQGDKIRLQCVGTSIKAFLNGEEVLSAVDSTITGSGRVGVWTNNDGAGQDAIFDNFGYKVL